MSECVRERERKYKESSRNQILAENSYHKSQGSLPEGEGSVQMTSLNHFRLVPFHIENII